MGETGNEQAYRILVAKDPEVDGKIFIKIGLTVIGFQDER
jgi:methylphosphotriester-DNA--protein-cysteine methyltransferase